MQECITPYRSIGSFADGKDCHFYSIEQKMYMILTTGKTYKIMSLPDLKIKFLSPTF